MYPDITGVKMKLSQLEVGMTVWSLSRTKMGNTGWKKEKPLLIRDRSGSARLATREEKARILDTK